MELKLAPGNNHEKALVDHAVTLQQVTYGLKGHFTLWKKPLYRRLIVFTTTF